MITIDPFVGFLIVLVLFIYLVFDWLSYRKMQIQVRAINILLMYNLQYMTKNFKDYGTLGSLNTKD